MFDRWVIRSLVRREDACTCDIPLAQLSGSELVASDPVVPKRINRRMRGLTTFLIRPLFRSHSMFSSTSRGMRRWSSARLVERVASLSNIWVFRNDAWDIAKKFRARCESYTWIYDFHPFICVKLV